MPEGGPPCEYLDWDSKFFSLRIGRVAGSQRLDPQSMLEILTWCRSQSIDVLYFLADPCDPATPRLAEQYGFNLVDVRVVLGAVAATAAAHGDDDRIRLFKPEDVPALASIARSSHRDSRFYFDGRFPEKLCDALYETWIVKSCNGYADAVFVADEAGRAAGYISCHLDPNGEGRIGLVAVGAAAQGKGIGRSLVERALEWFSGSGVRSVSVVTQGRNCHAQRLYQRCGFTTRSLGLWYHLWLNPPPEGSAR